MLFQKKKLSEVGEDEIRNLIANEVEENLTLDYKELLGANTKEIAKDISAMANNEGGLIIYGIEEENSRPKKIKWINIKENFEERLNQIVGSTIEPFLSINIFPITNPMDSQEQIYLVHISRSTNNLHGVIKDKDYGFYMRDGTTTRKMSIREVEERFSLIQNKRKNLQEYMEKMEEMYSRISKINLENIRYCYITIIPEILTERKNGTKLMNLLNKANLKSLYPISGTVKPEYEGNVIITNYYQESEEYYKNILIIHKNGCIEKWEKVDYIDYINLFRILNDIVKTLLFALELFNELNYYGGFSIILTLRAYTFMEYESPFNSAPKRELRHTLIKEKIDFNQTIGLSEEEIKSKLKDLLTNLGGYCGLSINDFKHTIDQLETNSLTIFSERG